MQAALTKQVNDWLHEHREYYHSGATREILFRKQQLHKLKQAIKQNEQPLIDALRQDLGKSEFEAYTTEIGIVLKSIGYAISKLTKWAKPTKVRTPLHLLPSRSFIIKEPYGTVLIIGPFNYPFQLLMEPLIGAIAAGNCVILKPSEHTPHVAAVVERLVRDTFEEPYIRVVQGEREVTSALIHAPLDYIFFTGSVPVGKIVMEAAAKNLVPVTLELGGKSPVIVDSSAKLELAAKRIVWGKLLNTGQTCIAPDYVLVRQDQREELLRLMKAAITDYYGADPKASPDYGRIVNERQFDRLAAILSTDSKQIVAGGRVDRSTLYMEPTLLSDITWDHAVMADEIFGPILPILTYTNLDEAIHMINARPKPLALYLFAEDKEVEQRVLGSVSFGGGCVNDTIMHAANHHLPFGGVGNSGIGAYHGSLSFDVFTHRKSIVKKSTRLEPGLIFPPFKDKLALVKRLLK